MIYSVIATKREPEYKIVRGSLGVCEACAAGKAKQKNVPKESDHEPAKLCNERMFLDISTVNAKKNMDIKVTKKNWRILIEDSTQMKW